MHEILQAIADTPLFNGLPEGKLKKISGVAVDKKYAKGQTVFNEGGNGNGFYVAKSNIRILDFDSLVDLAEHGKISHQSHRHSGSR